MKQQLLSACVALAFVLLPWAQAEVATDVERFRHEYEIMNGRIALDGLHTYSPVNIPEDLPIFYLEADDVAPFLDEGTGVLYLGYPECPWCRALLPVLWEAIDQAEFSGNVYYYNAQFDRDSRYLNEKGEIVVEREGSEVYRALLDKLDAWLDPYPGLNDPTVKRIVFPTTVFLQEGEVLEVHVATVTSHTDGNVPLTDAQHDELLALLTESLERFS